MGQGGGGGGGCGGGELGPPRVPRGKHTDAQVPPFPGGGGTNRSRFVGRVEIIVRREQRCIRWEGAPATTVRVIHTVHRHATHHRAPPHPPLRPRLPDLVVTANHHQRQSTPEPQKRCAVSRLVITICTASRIRPHYVPLCSKTCEHVRSWCQNRCSY